MISLLFQIDQWTNFSHNCRNCVRNENHKSKLGVLTAYIGTFHASKGDGSECFSAWSNQTLKTGAV